MSRQWGDVTLGNIELFCLAAEHGSFSAAALQAGLTPAAVSRAIARLEARLQVRLFVRSTRRIRLTDGGRAYFTQCRQALAQLVDAERELTGEQVEPSGPVRMSLPTPLGHRSVLPLLPRFRSLYPQIDLQVHLSNRNVDLVAEGLDVAIRGRIQPDSGLVARKLLDAELVVVAAPDYLRDHGRPQSLEDLAAHECIQFLLPSTGQPVPWLFNSPDGAIELATRGGCTCSEDLLGTSTLAVAGAGIVQTYRFIVEDELRDGRLVELLQPFGGRSRPFSVVYPGGRHMPLRLRVFIDFLVRELGAAPGVL